VSSFPRGFCAGSVRVQCRGATHRDQGGQGWPPHFGYVHGDANEGHEGCLLSSPRSARMRARGVCPTGSQMTPLLTDHHSGDDRTEPTTGVDDFKCALMEKEGRRHVPCVGGHSPRGMLTVALHCPLHTALRMLMAAWGMSDGTSHVVGRSFVFGMTFLERSDRCARLPV
jgi:hypothetical protein